MLTPQEVSGRSFTKATFGGYNMAQVDEFLDILTSDYSALYSENAVLKSKMKVLVDKVEEYRSTEEAMRKALMTAQRMADELVSEAEQKKTQLLQDAETEIQRQVNELHREVEAEQFRLQTAQTATAAFVAKVCALQKEEAALLDQLQNLCPQDIPLPEKDPVTEAVSEIDDNVQRLLAQALSDATAENLRAKAEEENDLSDTAEFIPYKAEAPAPQKEAEEEQQQQEAPPADQYPEEDIRAEVDEVVRKSRIDFDGLQFGRDYQIK